MRISVLSFCIVLSLFFVPAVFAQENAPGYANDRFYPDSVQQSQEDPSWWEQSFCQWFGGFVSFGCQGVRSQHVLSPDELKATINQVDAEAAKLQMDDQTVQGIHTQAAAEILAEVEKEIEQADSLDQVLGIQEVISAIFGGGEGDKGFINTYKPSGVSFCDDSSDPRERTKCLAVALRPASVQAQIVPTDPNDPIDANGDGVPDNIPTNPNAPTDPNPQIPENPPIGPQPAPTGNGAGYDLVAGIRAACRYNGTPGRVHETNADCLYNVIPRLGFGVVPELRNSALAYTNLQCVGFVRCMNLHFKGKALDKGGNANMFATNIPTGYRLVHSKSITSISPKVGDLLLWNTGAFGHIAYIITVYDTKYVDVIEANWGVDGLVQVRRVNVRAYDILGWLTQ